MSRILVNQRFHDLPRDDKTRDEFSESLKTSFQDEVEGKASEAQMVRDFWAAVKPHEDSPKG